MKNLLIALLIIFYPTFVTAEMTVLTNQTTFFVSPNGLDSNNGLTENTPWKDLQFAYNQIQNNYDLRGQTVILQLAEGIYNSSLQATGLLRGQLSPGNFIIRGNIVRPENVIIKPSGTFPSFTAAFGAMFHLEGVKMDHSNTSQDMIMVGQYSTISIAFVEFGENRNPYNHITVAFLANLIVTGDYKISGSGQTHLDVANQSTVYYNTNGIADLIKVTIVNSPSFFAGFFYIASTASVNAQAINWLGFVLGPQYVIEGNSILDIGGTLAENFPGTVLGVLRTNGQLLNNPGNFVMPAASELFISASPIIIKPGEKTTITWRANNITPNPSCWINQNVGNGGYFTDAPDLDTTFRSGITSRGQKVSEPLYQSTTYILRCLDIFGANVASAPITVVVQ